jgi:hypothetical protein
MWRGDKVRAKRDWRGPYASEASVTLMIARELRREIMKRHKLLAEIRDPTWRRTARPDWLRSMQAQHLNAQQTLSRAQDLLRSQSGPQSNVDSALAAERALAAQIVGAQAQLKTAQINLGYTEIRGPIDGKISSTAVTEGNVVSPSSGTLASLRRRGGLPRRGPSRRPRANPRSPPVRGRAGEACGPGRGTAVPAADRVWRE